MILHPHTQPKIPFVFLSETWGMQILALQVPQALPSPAAQPAPVAEVPANQQEDPVLSILIALQLKLKDPFRNLPLNEKFLKKTFMIMIMPILSRTS